jgi:hypothetical protein
MQRAISGLAVVLCLTSGPSVAQMSCAALQINDTASVSLQPVSNSPPQHCATGTSHDGLPIPDPACTPGAVNPTLTIDVVRNPSFRTSCLRSHATTEEQKCTTYDLYGIPHPPDNTGPNQICELDHLVPLELGGADTLDNIWPMCGPPDVALSARYFKEKDIVENYLAKMVKTGQMDLGQAQHGIATDWTQYLAAAQKACPSGRC